MSDVQLWYFAHPVAPPCRHNRGAIFPHYCEMAGRTIPGSLRCNLASARRWFEWVLEHAPDVAIVCPWLPYLCVADEAEETASGRARGLRDCVAVAARCHGIILVGGRISEGMEIERDAVIGARGAICDLTRVGLDPPSDLTADDWPWPLGRA